MEDEAYHLFAPVNYRAIEISVMENRARNRDEEWRVASMHEINSVKIWGFLIDSL